MENYKPATYILVWKPTLCMYVRMNILVAMPLNALCENIIFWWHVKLHRLKKLPSTEHLICLTLGCYDKQIVMNVVFKNLIHLSIMSLQLESVKSAWWLCKINCSKYRKTSFLVLQKDKKDTHPCLSQVHQQNHHMPSLTRQIQPFAGEQQRTLLQ